MTNHYWDRVSAPHAARDRSEPADRDADNAPSDEGELAPWQREVVEGMGVDPDGDEFKAARADVRAGLAIDDRECDYIEAILNAYDKAFCEGLDRKPGPAEEAGAKIYARAAMKVADREQKALRDEVMRLRSALADVRGNEARLTTLDDVVQQQDAAPAGPPLIYEGDRAEKAAADLDAVEDEKTALYHDRQGVIREVERLRATIARVEGLADELDRQPLGDLLADQIRDALRGPEPTEDGAP